MNPSLENSRTRCWRSISGLLLAFAALAVCLPSALAQASTDPLAIDLAVFKVATDTSGSESFSPATDASPGDTLIYQATFTNRSADQLRDVRPYLPIPAGTVFVQGTESPGGAAWVLSDGTELAPEQAAAQLRRAAESAVDLRVQGVRWGPMDLHGGQTFDASLKTRLPES